MTPAIIGGLLLILASYFVSQGKILYSVMIFFFADLCWVFISFSSGDIFGSITISIGMMFGVISYYKMNKGLLRKDLNW